MRTISVDRGIIDALHAKTEVMGCQTMAVAPSDTEPATARDRHLAEHRASRSAAA